MLTVTRLRWFSCLLAILFFFARRAVAFASFATHSHHEYLHDDLNAMLKHLPKESNELVKRQLGDLLAGLTEGLTGGSNAAGAVGSGLGILDGFGVLGGLGEITWPFDVWYRFPFVPPGPDDQRGPCVGLNAMANHNVISHTGVVGMFEAISGAMALGMGFDTALFIALQAVLQGGDPVTLTFSIGGPDFRVGAPLGGLGGLLSQPQGLEYSHNFAEHDSSSTRDDLYDTGDCATMNVGRFIELWNLVPPGGRFDLSVYAYWAAYRFRESIHISPNFFHAPLFGLFIRTGAYALVPRLLANQSGLYADGELTHPILESFFGVSHYPVPFSYLPGHEKIPENWYGLRSVGSSWPAIQVLADCFSFCGMYDELCGFGGNVAGVDTYVGVRLDDPVSGIANFGQLFDPTNFLCFLLQFIKSAAPTSAGNLFATLFETLGTTVATVGCPEIPDLTRGGVPLWASLEQQFPGARRAV